METVNYNFGVLMCTKLFVNTVFVMEILSSSLE